MHCVARTVSCCGLGTFRKVYSASLLLDRTVSDFAVGDNLLGLIVAAMSVVSSGMQQIFCRSMQQKHKLSSHELLSNTAPAQVRACQPWGLTFCAQNSVPCACSWQAALGGRNVAAAACMLASARGQPAACADAERGWASAAVDSSRAQVQGWSLVLVGLIRASSWCTPGCY